MTSNIDKNHIFRLKPGIDLKISLQNYLQENDIKAGWIFTCVGSLTTYAIRFANSKITTIENEYFEIITLSGTLSIYGSHLHISIADCEGKTISGHLMDGCIIYTTAEIVLTESADYIFERKNDGSTPWKELQIIKQ